MDITTIKWGHKIVRYDKLRYHELLRISDDRGIYGCKKRIFGNEVCDETIYNKGILMVRIRFGKLDEVQFIKNEYSITKDVTGDYSFNCNHTRINDRYIYMMKLDQFIIDKIESLNDDDDSINTFYREADIFLDRLIDEIKKIEMKHLWPEPMVKSANPIHL